MSNINVSYLSAVHFLLRRRERLFEEEADRIRRLGLYLRHDQIFEHLGGRSRAHRCLKIRLLFIFSIINGSELINSEMPKNSLGEHIVYAKMKENFDAIGYICGFRNWLRNGYKHRTPRDGLAKQYYVFFAAAAEYEILKRTRASSHRRPMLTPKQGLSRAQQGSSGLRFDNLFSAILPLDELEWRKRFEGATRLRPTSVLTPCQAYFFSFRFFPRLLPLGDHSSNELDVQLFVSQNVTTLVYVRGHHRSHFHGFKSVAIAEYRNIA